MAKHNKDPKSKFIQNGRIGTHLSNVSAASPKGYTKSGLSEVHHILCHSCVQDAAIFVSGVDKPYVLKCLAITDWDVNNPKNLIGLPKKWAYVLDYAGYSAWDKLPCHQHDHGRFTDAVKKWLNANVWAELKGMKEGCAVAEKDIQGLLDEGSSHWQDFLVGRGAMLGGTKICWDERSASKKRTWYIPFSMAPGPSVAIPRRHPPPASIVAKLGKIMGIIK